MLSFATPTALLALFGLLVPLAIHLWNRRPGRVVPVGALRWLTPGANRRMRQLHLTQWPLLLLRLVLLTLLALALAGPQWRLPPRPVQPQVFISPAALASPAFAILRPTVDSLRRRGAELRLLRPGFPPLTDSLTIKPGQAVANADPADASNEPASLWVRAAEAADSFPDRPLYLYTTTEARYFRGNRPVLPAQVCWQAVPTAADSSAWLEFAARPAPDSLRLVVGYSSGRGTTFRTFHQPWPAQVPATVRLPTLPALQLRRQAQQFVIEATGKAQPRRVQPPVPVELPLRVGVYFDAQTRADDARYVRAALRAAAPAYPAGLQLTMSTTPPVADSLDWLIWLADSPPPPALEFKTARSLHLLRDAPGPSQTVSTSFEAGALAKPVQLLRRFPAASTATAAIWRDAMGQPVLSVDNAGRTYQLHTRFHPAWSSLPTDGQLPALLLELLTPAERLSPADARLLDPTQLLAAGLPVPRLARRAPAAELLDLRPWLALVAGVLFGLERVLARPRSVTAPAA